MNVYRSARPLLFGLDPERAHTLSIRAAQAGLHPMVSRHDPRLETKVSGLTFANPLGVAAGYDKGAEVPRAMWASGYGHAEVGTITPRPQPGNPRPRVFRLAEDRAVINRYGFNSEGADVVRERIERIGKRRGVLGINVGANKDSEDFAADFAAGIETFSPLADYLTVNVSSPNTPGLRGLQSAAPLRDLIGRVQEARRDDPTPVFLKVAPDLEAHEIEAIADVLRESRMDGLIVSNTTLSRDGLTSSYRSETGGLSGAPLFERSTIVLARMARLLDGIMPLVGVGGVSNGQQALEKLRAGASLVQVYTGMIYEGPGLARQILRDLSRICDERRLTSLSEIVGEGRDDWADRPL